MLVGLIIPYKVKSAHDNGATTRYVCARTAWCAESMALATQVANAFLLTR